MALSELNQVAIAEICIYTPALFIAIFLAARHGFGRSSGWFYLILFSLIRIVGSGLELGTVSQPTNINLYIGAATLQNVGLSSLILVMLGLLSRVVESIKHNSVPLVTPRNIRLVQLLVMVGLILGIIGGSKLGGTISKNVQNPQASGTYTIPVESVAGLGCMTAGFGLLVIATIATAGQMSSVDDGEKRLLLAIGLALPFVIVRLVYSAMGTFANNPDFRSFGSASANYTQYLIGMAVVMEMAAVAIFEAVGLTLQKIPKGERSSVPMGTFRRRGHKDESYQTEGIDRV